jgi:hypothetical protein
VAGSLSATEPTVKELAADGSTLQPAPAAWGETAVIGPIADGTPAPPAPEPQLPDFIIRSTQVKKIMREGPSGVPGLQPVRREVNVTVQLVEDPHLPAPPPLSPPAAMSDPAVADELAEIQTNDSEVKTVFVSATVYDHQRTSLRWWPDGGTGREMRAWSNIDFNHLCGFSDYTYQGRRFSLTMGIGDESTVPLGIANQNAAEMAAAAQQDGSECQAPEYPNLPSDGPAFVVTEGDPGDTAAMDLITGLHELYKVEGTRLKAAYEAREQARIEREAYLRANPPQPQDVTIRVWKRETPSARIAPLANQPANQGGTP